MLCQNCNKNQANVHVTRVINGQKTEAFLCEACAAENSDFGLDNSMNIADLFSGLLSMNKASARQSYRNSVNDVCSRCGLTFDEFVKYGKLGCADCYRTFGDRLDPVIKSIHGSLKHQDSLRHQGETYRSKQENVEAHLEEAASGSAAGEGSASGKGSMKKGGTGSTANEKESLRRQLTEAIQTEAYEKAAQIRDRIKEIEAREGEA